MPHFKCWICTSYGVSLQLHKRKSELSVLSKENKTSSKMCWDIAYLAIKHTWSKNLGIELKLNCAEISEKHISVSFLDDTDLFLDRANAQNKM